MKVAGQRICFVVRWLHFVFISGYFGVKFSLSKLIALYSLAVFYCCLEAVIGGAVGNGYVSAVLDAWRAQDGYWFLHAYAMLMMVAPLMENVFIGAKDDHGHLLLVAFPVLFLVFVWSYLTGFTHLCRIVPHPLGITSGGSFITMLGIYVAARLFRFYDVSRVISSRVAIVCFVGMAGVISIGKAYLSSYASPFQFALAMFGFCLFHRIRLPGWMAKVVTLTSPSMFGVYLLHAMLYFPGMDNKVYALINSIRDPLIDDGMSKYFAYMIVAGAVFIISLVIDSIRRIMLAPVRGAVKKLNRSLDDLFSRFSCCVISKLNNLHSRNG